MNSSSDLPSFNLYQLPPITGLSDSEKAKMELTTILENCKIICQNGHNRISSALLSNELIKIKNILDQNRITENDLHIDSIYFIKDVLSECNEKFVLLGPDLKEASLALLTSLFISITTEGDDLYDIYFNLLNEITGLDFDLEDDLDFDEENESNLIITFLNNTTNFSLKDFTSLLNNASIDEQFTLFFNLKIQKEEFPFLSEFLDYYGENIEGLIIDHSVDDETVDEILLHCQYLNTLTITSKIFDGKNIKNWQTHNSLRKLVLSCENLISLDIPLPVNLEEILLVGCSNLEKFPSSLPSCLETFNIVNCEKLSNEDRTDYLIHLFKNNLRQGLSLITGFNIDDYKKMGDILIQCVPLEEIKGHVNLLKKFVPKPVLYRIMVKILNEDLLFFLNHAQCFPLRNIPDAVLKEIPTWVKLNQFKINLLNFDQKKSILSTNESIQEIEEVKMEEEKEIFLNELLSLFDAINFENSQEPDFISEKYLQIDGDSATKEQIRQGLEKLISNVKNLSNYTAVPKDLIERTIWYGDLKKDLQTIITLSNKPSNKETYPQELIRLGAAGHNCGTRWRKEAKDVISVLKNTSYEFKSISNTIEELLINYFEAIATEISFDFKDEIEDIMQPHLFNAICKIMKEMKFPLKETFIIDLNDPYLNSFYTSQLKKIKEKIEEYLIPLRIAYFLHTKIQDLVAGNQLAGEMILNAFKEIAEKELSFQIIRLESHFEERKLLCGIKKSQTLLSECLIKKAILENNEVEINKYKLANRMNFMRISQNFKKEMFELKEKKIVNIKKRKAEAPLEEGVLRGQKKPKIENTKDELNLDETILQYQKFITNPQDFENELKELGHESAAKEMRMQREELVNKYLEENALTEDDLMGNVHPTLEGILALLKNFNYLEEHLILKEIDSKI